MSSINTGMNGVGNGGRYDQTATDPNDPEIKTTDGEEEEVDSVGEGSSKPGELGTHAISPSEGAGIFFPENRCPQTTLGARTTTAQTSPNTKSTPQHDSK